MKLMRHEDVPTSRVRATFGYQPWMPLVLTVVFAGSLGFLTWAAYGWAVSWLAIVAMIVPGLLFGGLLLVVTLAMWHSALACFRKTNWVMKAADDGVYVQLRSYLNHHFPADKETVVFVPFDEVLSIGKMTVDHRSTDSRNESRQSKHHYLDIELRSEVQMQEVAQRVAEERALKARDFGESMKANHVPAMVVRDSWLRVEWRSRKMLDVFPEDVYLRKPMKMAFDDSDVTDPKRIEDEVLRLVEMGDTMTATTLLRRHEGMTLTEAKQFVDDLTETLAKPQ